VPNWHDISPRFGVSYDLFGDGKTAIKATLNRYVAAETMAFAQANNPVLTSVNSATRTWTDTNADYVPDCDLRNPLQNGECAQLNNLNFGKTNITTSYDPELRSGWNARGHNWETSGGVQHEIARGMSATVTYFRRWYGNFQATQNVATAASDYDQFCITAPIDSRLPGGGGYPICGLYDVKPEKFGQNRSLVTFADNIGSYWEHYNGVDMTVNARLPRGLLLQGGINFGRSEVNACGVVLGRPDLLFTQLDIPVQQAANTGAVQPRTEDYCDIKPPFQPSFKLLGSHNLPWGFQASASFQNVPGPLILASQSITNAQILPALGRNLSAGANSTITVDPRASWHPLRRADQPTRPPLHKVVQVRPKTPERQLRPVQRSECEPGPTGRQHLRTELAAAVGDSAGTSVQGQRSVHVLIVDATDPCPSPKCARSRCRGLVTVSDWYGRSQS